MSDHDRCIRCLLPNSLPGVALDDEGICRPCRACAALAQGSKAASSQGELERILGWAKAQRRPYDCLVPLSGGKDSTYALYLCARVYGLKCACVTFDNGYLSPHAKENIRHAVAATGSQHIYYGIDHALLIELYRLALHKSGQFCSVCMRGIGFATALAVARFRPALIISGHGRHVDYYADGLLPEIIEWGEAAYFAHMIKGEPHEKEARRLLIDRPRGVTPTLDSLANRVAEALPDGLPRRAWWAAHGRARQLLKGLGIERRITLPQSIALHDYVDISHDERLRVIQSEMGWSQPPDAGREHMDCLVSEIKGYIQTRKFRGLSKSSLEHSGQLRLGHMTIEEAQRIQEDELARDEAPAILEAFLADLGMTMDEFQEAVRDWKKIERFRTKPAYPERAP